MCGITQIKLNTVGKIVCCVCVISRYVFFKNYLSACFEIGIILAGVIALGNQQSAYFNINVIAFVYRIAYRHVGTWIALIEVCAVYTVCKIVTSAVNARMKLEIDIIAGCPAQFVYSRVRRGGRFVMEKVVLRRKGGAFSRERMIACIKQIFIFDHVVRRKFFKSVSGYSVVIVICRPVAETNLIFHLAKRVTGHKLTVITGV